MWLAATFACAVNTGQNASIGVHMAYALKPPLSSRPPSAATDEHLPHIPPPPPPPGTMPSVPPPPAPQRSPTWIAALKKWTSRAREVPHFDLPDVEPPSAPAQSAPAQVATSNQG
jgi:hypothetical protein